MALYEYRCEQDGVFEVTRALGTAPASVTCSVCGSEAQRILSLPMIRSGSRTAWTAAMDHAQKSRYEPDVVTSLPPLTNAPRRTIPLTPKLRGLPRP